MSDEIPAAPTLREIQASSEKTLQWLEKVDRMPNWTPDQLVKMFQTLPYLIMEESNKLTNLIFLLDEANLTAQDVEARLKIESIKLKQRKELTSESDRTAWVRCQPEYKLAVEAQLELKKTVGLQKNTVDRLNNALLNAKKAADIMKLAEYNIDSVQGRL